MNIKARSFLIDVCSIKNIIIKAILLLVFWCVVIYLEEKNPDWFGYQRLFEDGAWLAESGRDYGFLLLVKTFKLFVGNNYLLFRRITYIVFSIIVLIFLSENFLKSKTKESNTLLFSVAFIPLFFLRYTMQIREGFAISLVIFAFNIMFDFFEEERQITSLTHLKIVIFLLIASTIHSGLSFFLGFYILSILLGKFKINNSFDNIFKSISLFLFYISLIYFTINYLYNIKDSYYTGGTVIIQLTYTKIFYWIILGFIITWLIKINLSYLKQSNKNKIFRIFIKNVFCLLLLVFYCIGFWFVITQFSNSIVSAISRILSLTLCLNIFILSKISPENRKLIYIISLFLFFDQIRILIDSLTYNGFIY